MINYVFHGGMEGANFLQTVAQLVKLGVNAAEIG
jgi:hypothetical protein